MSEIVVMSCEHPIKFCPCCGTKMGDERKCPTCNYVQSNEPLGDFGCYDIDLDSSDYRGGE